MNQPSETTPEFEQAAALALHGLLSNPIILHSHEQLTNSGLETLADAAFRAAFFLERRLLQERTKG